MIPERMQELVAMLLLRIFPIEDPGNRMDFDKFDKRLLELVKEFIEPYIKPKDSKE